VLAIEVASLALLFVALPARAQAAKMPVVVDDPTVQLAVAAARSEFLAGQDFDRLQVTALVEDKDGRWLRGSILGDELAYPASCVKLSFLVGAVHWCAAQGKGPDCLDAHVRPMIVESDNVATGVVVDAISGAPNGPVGGADVNAFIEKRRYTERVLGEAGLLGNQRLFTKTYPTNSGGEPAGLEELAWKRLGRNATSTNLAANLMLAVQSGAIEPQATDYMRGLMRRPTFSGHSSLGGGLPPGSLHENKVGNAFDTLEDIVYSELPNGRRLIIAVLSNGYTEGEAEPGDIARLNGLTALLVGRLGIAQGLPEPSYPDAKANGDAQYSWRVNAPETGMYEIAVWYESDPAGADAAEYAIANASGRHTTRLDQRAWGARWIKLGDVELERGAGFVTVTNAGTGRLVPGKLRVTRWAK
jgi:protein phosphatase methylesterase 1